MSHVEVLPMTRIIVVMVQKLDGNTASLAISESEARELWGKLGAQLEQITPDKESL